MASCIGVSAYHFYLGYEVGNSYSFKQASKALQEFEKHFLMTLENVRSGRYWTILTPVFLHNDPFHLGWDMWAFWGWGGITIALYGLPTFAVLFTGSAIAGRIAPYFFWAKDGEHPVEAVGSSAAILGLISAITCEPAMRRMLMSYLIIPMPM